MIENAGKILMSMAKDLGATSMRETSKQPIHEQGQVLKKVLYKALIKHCKLLLMA